MAEPVNRWTLRVRGGEIDLPLVLLIRGTSLRAVIHNSDDVTTPELIDPNGRTSALGPENVREYLDLVCHSESV